MRLLIITLILGLTACGPKKHTFYTPVADHYNSIHASYSDNQAWVNDFVTDMVKYYGVRGMDLKPCGLDWQICQDIRGLEINYSQL